MPSIVLSLRPIHVSLTIKFETASSSLESIIVARLYQGPIASQAELDSSHGPSVNVISKHFLPIKVPDPKHFKHSVVVVLGVKVTVVDDDTVDVDKMDAIIVLVWILEDVELVIVDVVEVNFDVFDVIFVIAVLVVVGVAVVEEVIIVFVVDNVDIVDIVWLYSEDFDAVVAVVVVLGALVVEGLVMLSVAVVAVVEIVVVGTEKVIVVKVVVSDGVECLVVLAAAGHSSRAG